MAGKQERREGDVRIRRENEGRNVKRNGGTKQEINFKTDREGKMNGV